MAGEQTGAAGTGRDSAQNNNQPAKRARLRGFGSYILSLLLIVVPVGVAYYLHVENQTDYHQDRAFRALDEISQLMDQNVQNVENLYLLMPEEFGRLDDDLATDADKRLAVLTNDLQALKDRYVEIANDPKEDLPTKGSDDRPIDWKSDLAGLSSQLDSLVSYESRRKRAVDFPERRARELIQITKRIAEGIKEARTTTEEIVGNAKKQPTPPKSEATCSNTAKDPNIALFMERCYQEFLAGLEKVLVNQQGEYLVRSDTPEEIRKMASFKALSDIKKRDDYGKFAASETGEAAARGLTSTIDYFGGEGFKKQVEESVEVAERTFEDILGAKVDQAWFDLHYKSLSRINSRFRRYEWLERRLALKLEQLRGDLGIETTLDNKELAGVQLHDAFKDEIQEIRDGLTSLRAQGASLQVRSYLASIGKREAFRGITLSEQGEACDGTNAGSTTNMLRRQSGAKAFTLSVSKCAKVSPELLDILEQINAPSQAADTQSQAKAIASSSDGPEEEGEEESESKVPASLRFDVPLENLMHEARFRSEFDRILIANADGNVLMELETMGHHDAAVSDEGGKRYRDVSVLLHRARLVAAGVRFGKEDSELEEKLVSLSEKSIELGQATFVEFDRGDSSALAFIRPVKTSLTLTPGNETLHFIGIVKKSDFMTKAWRVSPMAVAIAGVLFVFGVLATPFIKLVLSGRHDSVSRGVAFLTLGCGVLATTMLALLILNFTLGGAIEAAFKATAASASRQLEEDVRAELGAMLVAAERDLGECPNEFVCTRSLEAELPKTWPPYQVAGVTDKKGLLISDIMRTYRKFKVRAGGDVSSRRYFSEANSGEGTPFTYRAEGQSSKEAKISLQRVVNLSDALKTTTIALGYDFTRQTLQNPVAAEDVSQVPEAGNGTPVANEVETESDQQGDEADLPEEPKAESPEKTSDIGAPNVTIIGGPLKTFAAPVMPLGFDFMVFDTRTGQSVANNRGYWDLTENVIRETDHNPVLEMAAEKKQAMSFGGRYYGNPVQMHARPIDGTNWMAVVHYDKSFLQAIRVQVMLIAFAETLAVIFVGMLPVVLWFFYRNDRWSWLFPMRCGSAAEQDFFRRMQTYLLGALLLAALGLLIVLEGHLRLVAMAMVIHALLYVRFLCSGQPFLHRRYRHRIWLNPVFASLAFLMLAGVVALPLAVGDDPANHPDVGGVIVVTAIILCLLGIFLRERYAHLGVGASKPVRLGFEGQKSRYIKAMTVSLALVSILPTSAAYLDAFTSYNNLVHRYGQLDAAEKIDGRYTYLRGYFAALDPLGAYLGVLKAEEKSFGGETHIGHNRAPRPARGAEQSADQQSVILPDAGPEADQVDEVADVFSLYDPSSPAYQGIMARRNIHDHGQTVYGQPSEHRLRYSWRTRAGDQVDADLSVQGAGYFLASIMPPVSEKLRHFQIPISISDTVSSGGRRTWFWEKSDQATQFWYKTTHPVSSRKDRGHRTWLNLSFDHEAVANMIGLNHIVQALLAGLLLLGVVYWVIEKVVRQLAATDVPLHRLSGRARHADETGSQAPSHRMVLRPTAARLAELDKEVRESKDGSNGQGRTAWLNLADDVLSDAQWTGQTPVISHLAIIGFEALIADKGRRAAALTLLENLVQTRPDIRLTLLCGHNMLFRLVRPDAYRDELDVPHNVHASECLRWGTLLARFRKEYGWFPSENPNWESWRQAEVAEEAIFLREARIFPVLDLPKEGGWFAPTTNQFKAFAKDYLPLVDGGAGDRQIDFDMCTSEEIYEVAGMFGGAFFRKLWAESTHAEKLALYQLASGKVLNTRNTELIGHLMRRGLIVAEPQLKVTSEAFARFVLAAETQATFQEWEAEAARSMWTVYRVPLIVLMMVLAIFLLSTARQEIDAAMGVLTGALALVPVLMRGMNLLRGG